MRQRISAIIHTLNEEENIGSALRSVASWVDEIIVVDMHSDDRTVEIARTFGAKVFLFERQGFVEPARNFSQDKASGEWIILLDADEIIPPELSQELVKIAGEDRTDVCYLPRLNYFGGFPLLHSGWGPEQDKLARFYRKGSFVHLSAIHSHPRKKDGCRILELKYRPGHAILHFNYRNVSHCIEKLNRYTDIEASQQQQNNKKPGARDMLLVPLREFANRYFRYQGFRDGWPGLYYSFWMAFYRMTQAMKLREMQTVGSAASVRTKYRAIAESCLAAYQSHINSKEA